MASGVTNGVTEQRFIEQWLSAKRRFRDDFWAVYHNKLPQWVRPRRAFALLLRLAIASSGPVIARLLSPDRVSWAIALSLSAVLFVMHAVLSALERNVANGPATAGGADELMIRAAEVIAQQTPPRDRAAREAIMRSALGMIEVAARQVVSAKPGELSVSLAVYVGNHTTKLKLNCRNPGNTRPVGREFDGASVLGHHACKAGTDPQVMNDLRRAPKALRSSPTQSAPFYRSFLIVPLRGTRNGVETVIGFVSIDCDQPYAFYGNRSKAIIVSTMSVIELIQCIV